MNYDKIIKLLWLLLAAVIILIVTVAVIDRITHSNKAVYSAQATASQPAAQNDVKVGNRIGFTAPDFTLNTIDNKQISLRDYRGKPVILNFWATWCGPCRYEVPSFKAFYDKYPEEAVVIIAVNTQDNPESALSYAKADGLKFVIPVDPRGVVANQYNVRGMPTTFFINGTGVITSIKIGPFLNVEEMEERAASFK